MLYESVDPLNEYELEGSKWPEGIVNGLRSSLIIICIISGLQANVSDIRSVHCYS
jgi:hypothetical protein